jgi:hypothetical protein
VKETLGSPVPLVPFYWQQTHAEDFGMCLVAGTLNKIRANVAARHETSLALESSIQAVRASRQRIIRTDVLLAQLWGQKEP